ncbi:hypothetical protein [Enterovibrio calviensis]|uniref:hypothetical protein n=1 Tax=Enterovibrio calviensis TaxID=91359 RepID=UPI0004890153|nr:hypothetical protein [Enterovibrio calviensis]
MVLTILLVLVVIHVCVEFYLFPVVTRRARHVFVSVIIESVLSLIALYLLAIPLIWSLVGALCIGLSNVTVSVWFRSAPNGLRYLFVKQLLHLFILVLVVLYVVSSEDRVAAKHAFEQTDWWTLFCWATAYLLAMKPSSTAIALLLQNWTEEVTHSAPSGSNKPLKDAGAFIGYFERMLIVTFVLWGQLPGVALVLAAKSVFRFGDLKDHGSRMFTEYVMLGTFASALFGIGCGLLGGYLSQI